MRQTNLEELDIGVIIGGRQINNLRHVDNTITLIAESKKEFLKLLKYVRPDST